MPCRWRDVAGISWEEGLLPSCVCGQESQKRNGGGIEVTDGWFFNGN